MATNKLICTACGHIGERFGDFRSKKCSSCGSKEIIPIDSPVGRRIATENGNDIDVVLRKEEEDKKKNEKGIGIVVLVIAGVILLFMWFQYLWFWVIPVIMGLYLYKKNKKLSPKTKGMIMASITALFILLGSMNIYGNRTPVITISEPENNSSIEAGKILVRGSVSPSDSKLTINYLPIEVDKDGNFSREIPLKDEGNILNIMAENGSKTTNTRIAVKRIFTPEEIAQREEADRKAKEAEARAKAEKEAELQAYYATPAGRICKAYPEWGEAECEALANGKIWVGMTYKMLVYMWGKPDSINPSNYGGGIKYQYCWHDYSPSCFYDRDGDGIIDAYN